MDDGRSFEVRRENLRRGTKELADSFERVRQFLLEYDAHDDRNGERWDAVREEFDKTMRQGIDTVAVLGAACESLLDAAEHRAQTAVLLRHS